MLARGPLVDLKALLAAAREEYGDRIAFCELVRGVSVSYSYVRLFDDVNALGAALISLGLQGKHIALIGENSYNWIVAYLSVICGCGVIVPLDKELTKNGLGHLVKKSDAEAVICSKAFGDAMRALMSENSAVANIVIMGETDESDSIHSMDRLIELGKKLIQSGDCAFSDSVINPLESAAILFTSGTTGANKGVMLSHQNICSNINSLAQVIPDEPNSFSVLPMNHSFEFNCHVLPGIYGGITICINPNLKHLADNMRFFKPAMSVVVPLFIDEIYANIWSEARRQKREKVLRRAVALSNILRLFGIDLREKLFKKIKEGLGGELRLLICGGAPIGMRAAVGLSDFGIRIMNGYGITECSPLVTLNPKIHRKVDSVGIPMPGIEVKIDAPDGKGVGEILVRGKNVMIGYYNDEYSNSVSFEGEWFKTGDYGKQSLTGALFVVGRKKNLIVLDNGKNVHPEEIESLILSQLSYVKDIVVHEAERISSGRMQRSVAAVIGIDPKSEMSRVQKEERDFLVAEDIKRVNKQLPSYKRICMIKVSTEQFEKTTTLKVVRQSVIGNDKYAPL
ncbi:MAG: AMP-binding protein [Christensenellales bacterium]